MEKKLKLFYLNRYINIIHIKAYGRHVASAVRPFFTLCGTIHNGAITRAYGLQNTEFCTIASNCSACRPYKTCIVV